MLGAIAGQAANANWLTSIDSVGRAAPRMRQRHARCSRSRRRTGPLGRRCRPHRRHRRSGARAARRARRRRRRRPPAASAASPGSFAGCARVRDSKQLTPAAREELSGYIWEHALAAGVAFVPVSRDRPDRDRGGLAPGLAWSDRGARREARAPVARCLPSPGLPAAADADHRRRREDHVDRLCLDHREGRPGPADGRPARRATRATASSRTRATPRRSTSRRSTGSARAAAPPLVLAGARRWSRPRLPL